MQSALHKYEVIFVKMLLVRCGNNEKEIVIF